MEIEVESAIKVPDFIEPSAENRSNAWKKICNRYLRVTFKEESDKVLMISVVKKYKG